MATGGATPGELRPGELRPGELRIVGTTVAREIDLLLDGLARSVGKRPPRVIQVGSRTLVADRNVRNWRNLVAKRFGAKARFVGLDLVEGKNVDCVADICGNPRTLHEWSGLDRSSRGGSIPDSQRADARPGTRRTEKVSAALPTGRS